MLDFVMISTKTVKKDFVEIYPRFIIKKSSDLMIRGSDFYAIWLESENRWSTEEQDVITLIDEELDTFYEENRDRFENVIVKKLYLWDADSGMIDKWHKYCQKQCRDNFHILDETLIFSNDKPSKEDYSSHRLNYPLKKGSIEAYNRLMSVLYSPDERHKLEWAIGSIITGDSKKLQKFQVLYGSAGTGKSTILNIIQKLFNGYYSVFDAKALGSSNNTFALEAFKGNPLVAIQHDGDLSRIEDNTRLNSLVSHELMVVNEKFKSTYESSFKCFLFIGTNKPVKITDAKSGLIRRLIDVTPTGDKMPFAEYSKLVKQIDFELGAIAWHCKELYLKNPEYYDDYIPIAMLGASNSFYNFVEDSYGIFKKEECVTLTAAWEMYKTYCEEANVSYPFSKMIFKEELKSYFKEYHERYRMSDGTRVRNCYVGFRSDRFEPTAVNDILQQDQDTGVIELKKQKSVLDDICKSCFAQYANEDEYPEKKWSSVKTLLHDIDTKKLHYVKLPENHIVIDFDLKDQDGNKSLELNLKEASKWPPTYSEVSKGGNGLHLHYIYTGDVNLLNPVYEPGIEVKVFKGNAALRRRLSLCNALSISAISSGLPLKKSKKMINITTLTNEKVIRTVIRKNLRKEYHGATKPSIDFIFKILEDAYKSGIEYDVTDMRNAVLAFAVNSSNNSDYCVKLVNKMKFCSEETKDNTDIADEKPIAFFDIEVFPNLFLVNWKYAGKDQPMTRLINPTTTEIAEMLKLRLIGFNNRRYDNHILYAALMGYTNEMIYELSRKIISGSKQGFFSEAYNLSYTDIYDFSSDKKSLKKLEIELGLRHRELNLPWDKPVPKERWKEVSEYCDNDVLATEAAFNHYQPDFLARQILADLAGMTVNDTTNSLTTRIIFGNNRKPQASFNYRNMAEYGEDKIAIQPDGDWTDARWTWFDSKNRPIFPGYSYSFGKSIYRGEVVGEGGYVYAEPGIYYDVSLLDVVSMHPTSAIAENLFGEYTKRFEDLVQARIAIKHKDIERAKKMLDGKLAKYLNDISTFDTLALALKIVINSVYGLTAASFDNAFHDIRNVDNIVAKRGALFMINLKHEVQQRGYIVAHIKTDSIKIPNATVDIIQFVKKYGKLYGYSFEHEATYDRMCLVNDAVYIAKFATPEKCEELYGKKYMESEKDICKDNFKHSGKWTATGTQFAVPYVFKTLFSHEPLEFEDYCLTKSVTSSMHLNFNEENENEHNLVFVGRVGSFCPVMAETGGGQLLRESIDKNTGEVKYSAISGTKGYRWREAEIVKNLNKENTIDISYYEKLADEAKKTINKYGNFNMFAA